MVDIGKKTKKIAERLNELEKFAKESNENVSDYVRGYDAALLSVVFDIREILNENKKDSE